MAITELPGWDGPLPSKWFSGYLKGGERESGIKLVYHYILILSEGDPENDPLVLWTNGGPGASSLFGLMTELGPFYLSDESLAQADGEGIPKLFRNEKATWTKNANVVILNGPPPVSFSFCDPPGPSGDGHDCGVAWNDTTSAEANYEFLESFFEAYPKFRDRDFFLTGESYAGIYIPKLVEQILAHPKEESYSRRALKGVAIGNGCIGKDIMCSDASGSNMLLSELLFKAEFLYGHGQFSPNLYKDIKQHCDPAKEASPKCSALLEEMKRQVGGYFDYNLYDTCWGDQSLPVRDARRESLATIRGGQAAALESLADQNRASAAPILGAALNDYPCGGGTAMTLWVKHASVRKALGVPEDANFVSGDNSASIAYDITEPNLMPFMVKLAKETDLRVLIYNGDTDPTINSVATFWWVNELGLKEVEPWSPWTLDGKKKMGGYVTRYEGDFDYLTIRGSGHMVPAMKPDAALEMLTRWLRNEPWRPYNA
ncbi:Lysosomal protective protein [Hondaea fermentalgiana]|uniref:Carboxypeptidase n=1 Tax=Hondaea fermentalgiana TaxID=2315210 RepID=A0A2R5G7Y3_9STRA|nr:Lysosomal protective protein [Hondaea fermentalgiana]|eukprot:GBG27100.1 Lysosomal protective protein [Hondaea fermentalgiana]